MRSRTTAIEISDRSKEKVHRPSLYLRLFKRLCASFTHGQLTIHLPNGKRLVKIGENKGPSATLDIRRWRVLFRLVNEGDIGLAGAYIDGDWTTENLSAVLDYGMANETALVGTLGGIAVTQQVNRVRHLMRHNSRKGSRRNIAAHYDLGNTFYEYWLDPGMQYSSGIYQHIGEDLKSAQNRKLEKINSMLDLKGSEKILEIGCGWGAVAESLLQKYPCELTGITLSKEQAAYAGQRLRSQELAGNASIELRDYRDVSTRYDRIVSIEMFEAVGKKYWPVYFNKVAQSLNAGGFAVLQVITIAERYFKQYCNRPDFIQKYIFPGGMLPTRSALQEEAANAELKIVDQFHFGDSYNLTLQAWHQAFHTNWGKIAPLGFDDRFRRMWDYYLQYCETGFKHGAIDVGLYKLIKVD